MSTLLKTIKEQNKIVTRSITNKNKTRDKNIKKSILPESLFLEKNGKKDKFVVNVDLS